MGTKFTQLKNDLSKNNWLVFVMFMMYNFHLSLVALYNYFRRAAKKLSEFLLLNWFLHVFFTFMVCCFLECYLL